MTTELADMHPVFRDAICCHWMIGSAFNIPAEKLFVAFDPKVHRLIVIVRDRGLEFAVDVGELAMTREEGMRGWSEAVRAYKDSSTDEKTALIEGAKARDGAVDLIAAMVTRGFVTQPIAEK